MRIFRIFHFLFPLSFVAKEKKASALVLSILLYTVVIVAYCIISSILGFLFGNLVAWLTGLLGTLVGLYSTCGILLSVLKFFGVFK
jgi:hypothetical protein